MMECGMERHQHVIVSKGTANSIKKEFCYSSRTFHVIQLKN